jgi:superfamily II DNA/RNA helicase
MSDTPVSPVPLSSDTSADSAVPAADVMAPVAASVTPAAAEPVVAAAEAAPVNFDSFGLHPDILKAVLEQGYTVPTPIQAQAIPVVLAGRDMMGAAQTGTGKTASFALPIIQRLLPLASNSASPARHPVRALILTPTRELADQVADNVHNYAKHTALRSIVVFGGVDMNAQAAELKRGVEILIATPGRLLDHVQQKNTSLGQVQMLVLDEADRMLDMGFLPDLQRILDLLPKQRQTLLFSATFSNEIKKLSSSYLRDPVTIETSVRNSTATNVKQIVFEVAEGDKQAAVVQLIRERGLKQVIVFCNSKIGAGRLARQIERDGIVSSAIHGDKSQLERMQALEAFKRGELVALVATDVAARGIDISDLPAVINFDLPFNAEDYVHRIGRTGRAGASGDALSLCAPNERKQLADIESLIKRPLERGTLTIANPAPAVRERSGERGERATSGGERGRGASPVRSRYEDDSRGARGGHAAPAERSRHVRSAPHKVEDEIFSKPYVPSPVSRPVDGSGDASQGKPKSASKRPVAALLGGLTRKPS